MKWFWVHPVSGGAILIALSNVCYLVTYDRFTEVHFTNGEVIKVLESEKDFLSVFGN
jgi:hypothetical protein